MRLHDERELAARLARVLDGDERAEGELRELAELLELAVAPARFAVPEDEIERALSRTPRPEAAPSRRGPRFRYGALAAAAAAGAAVLAVTLTRGGSPLDVTDEARAALGGTTEVLRVVERIEPAAPGRFPASIRVGWLDDPEGRAIWNQFSDGRRIAVTLLEHGRVSRYLVADNVVIVGPSCRAFASGCAELVDPISLYRRALETHRAHAKRRGDTLVVRLPAQRLPDAVRIEQVVTLDARTYRPLRIEWETDGRSFAVIRVTTVKVVQRRFALDFLNLVLPANVRVVQRVAPGRALRKLGERVLASAEARALRPPLQWLGDSYRGRIARPVHEIRWNVGRAYRIRYGELTLWNYGRVVPPEILSAKFVPAKTIPLRNGRIVRFYIGSRGRLVAELEGAGRSVAIVGPEFGKEALFAFLEDLRPLR